MVKYPDDVRSVLTMFTRLSRPFEIATPFNLFAETRSANYLAAYLITPLTFPRLP